MKNVTDRLIKGSVWLSFSRAIVNGLSALSTFVLAWYLAPSDFGLVAIATTIQIILSSVTDLSLGQALIRHESPSENHFSAVWTLSVTRSAILGLVFAAGAYPIAEFYSEPRLVGVMFALSFSLFMSGLGNPRRVMLQRDLIFWQEFVLNVSQKLIGFIVTVAVAAIYQSYWALVIGTLAYQVTNIIVSYTVLPFWPRITFRHARELFSFSLWLTAGQIVNTLNWRVEYLLIGKWLGATELGHYTVGNTLSTLPTREATAPLNQTIYPGFSRVRHDPVRLTAAYQRAQALLAAVALPAGIGMAVVADPMIRLALGEKWIPAIFIVQALASVFALQTLGSLVQALGMAKGHTKLLFIRDTQMLVTRVPIIIVGLLLAGLPGVIYARVLTGLISTVVNMLLVKRLIGLAFFQQLAANFRALVSVAFMAAGILGLSHILSMPTDKPALALHLAILVVTGGIIYVGSSLTLWIAMKKPNGPETEVQRIVIKTLSKARRIAVPKSA
ncbi:oligosaccharide flippase family protein [Rhizobium laguerreae]|uniref:lipopolysaccharide biosynthesis protein n=1 Tax=Rhizobium laguerreae TaxID=1076926 RepID=UPI00143F7CF8|nr:lipopolysaccharide biosynthesis protein [Rhizobium laguerreae]MBY3068894.1 lipopolysaccharide biosynthesis protein [Rhizobium laguerreae]MBY3160056.1 lipopolysaccharide biosynthesis protein [Rhizobium laguerreae]MBY3240281.1 lipopolysaccharide biosynthesis protein [Rhizobium laguerreae]MBY3309512.1 lipopolysaccharide biosynthesis protein [Rhizobium laguerreae]NKM88462.1 oligosaccharide flippase family protein [Rhizobium laguerreae]